MRKILNDPKSRPKPWERGNPRPAAARVRLSDAQRAMARDRARSAGRRYPNLVDNMWAATSLDADGRPKQV
ncbi:hypothetical protein E4582_02520 [Luteimonas yindakuii]|uniref:Uncharacterized protein n=1 Tax=Luteimonas yindakuii TaxID=2565782 RepID=A0A4Z1R5D8_9GAMM|nr:hypothetical protein [Luteimonas yindakuii]TKS53755.1 hypothetical protein E4582_02520 [Luteimonas yindakuii]